MRILLAGSTGSLGRHILAELSARGHHVRAVIRPRSRNHPRTLPAAPEVIAVDALSPNAWANTCDTIDVVISTIGASVDPSPLVGHKPYTAVDAPANTALLAEAQRAGVRRFVYVSLIGGATSRALNYAEGHERVVDAIRASAIPATILRPTGFHCAMAALIDIARHTPVPVIGDGSNRTNPIDERDLALAAANAAESTVPGLTEVDLGGPDVFTRREIAELACRALAKPPRLIHIPAPLVCASAHALRVINPRAGHFTLFAAHIMTHECLAPPVGTRTLTAYFTDYIKRSHA